MHKNNERIGNFGSGKAKLKRYRVWLSDKQAK